MTINQKLKTLKFMVTTYQTGPGVRIVFQAGIPNHLSTGQGS